VQQRHAFTLQAAEISKRIGETATKLEKLAQLSRSAGLFHNPELEMNELTGMIKEDIRALKAALEALARQSIERNADSRQHSSAVVKTLQGRLASTTHAFEEVLRQRSEAMRSAHEARRQFTGSLQLPASLLPEPDPDRGLALRTPPPQLLAGGGGGAGAEPDGGAGLGLVLVGGEAAEEQLAGERLAAARHIESVIIELHGMFGQLNQMIAQQGELALAIDHNVEQSLDRVQRAQDQLLKYYRSLSSNRLFLIKIFLVLLFFAVLFIVFFV
jgi:syntaxin 5